MDCIVEKAGLFVFRKVFSSNASELDTGHDGLGRIPRGERLDSPRSLIMFARIKLHLVWLQAKRRLNAISIDSPRSRCEDCAHQDFLKQPE
jgi:hypothetical protein